VRAASRRNEQREGFQRGMPENKSAIRKTRSMRLIFGWRQDEDSEGNARTADRAPFHWNKELELDSWILYRSNVEKERNPGGCRVRKVVASGKENLQGKK